MVSIKTRREIELMRQTCALAAQTLKSVGDIIRPGITTEDINTFTHEYIVSRGAIPSPLNYHGFPKSVCTSPNNVICHGIPSKKVKLKEGDIVNVDVTTYLNNYHGDTNKTFFVGNVSDKVKTLVQCAYDSMMIGISKVRPGARLGDIGNAIQEFAENKNYSVVRDYCGHGIGKNFHEDPQVLHYGKKGTGLVLRPGMTFTIEPMLNIGDYKTKVLEDGWTVITADGSLSAQFEHTILVTNDDPGYEILTWID